MRNLFKTIGSIFKPEGGVIGKLIDMADDAKLTVQESIKMKMDLLKHYEPFKLAQRYIALPYSYVFLFFHVVAGILKIIEGIKGIDLGSGELFKSNNETMGLPCSIIFSFYFGGGVINSFKNK